MLVVTRRPGEKLTFPTLGITIHLLHQSGAVRVGVDAPPDVRILRDELVPVGRPQPTAPPADRHARANALSKLTLAIHLARKQWAAGRPAAADATLAAALAAVETMDRDRAAAAPPPTAARCRALVVDDDANQRELLAGLLDMNGCECATAADGEEALTYLATHARPDVVLLDMAMPRCDGPETLRRIRADGRLAGLRVFSVSGTRPDALGAAGAPGGFDGWFPKPLNPRRLWEAMQAAAASPAVAN
jgi:CheY-like chemotaxis protein